MSGNMPATIADNMTDDSVICSECGKAVDREKACIIDKEPVCLTCMYGEAKPIEIYPIGTVRTGLQNHSIDHLPAGAKDVSRIDLLPSQNRFMYKLNEEAFLTIVYCLHKAKPVKSVFHRGLDGKKVGVFASRTPNRPSRIAIQEVKLLKIKGNTLYVEDLDALDGSPVLDIKLGMRRLTRWWKELRNLACQNRLVKIFLDFDPGIIKNK